MAVPTRSTAREPEAGDGARLTVDDYRVRNRAVARSRAVVWLIIAAGIVWATWGTGFGIMTFVQGIGSSVVFISQDLLPPRLDAAPRYIQPLLETVYMSVVGLGISVALSVPVGILAARNTTAFTWVAYLAKMVAGFARAIPSLVLAIFLVAVLGIGPLAGALALGIGGVGILAKAYGDSIEEIDMGQIEALRAAGGSWLQILGQGVWPQCKPSFVTWTLYRFDRNIRGGAVLGLVGAGGLGYSLDHAISLYQFKTATTIILMIYGLILLMELATGMLRKRAI